MNTPVHDWAEHGASALRYFAVKQKEQEDLQLVRERAAAAQDDSGAMVSEDIYPDQVSVRASKVPDFDPRA